MSERTGATNDQIVTAAKRLYEHRWAGVGVDDFDALVGDQRKRSISNMAAHARHLVPPTARIVEDWAETAAALRRVLADHRLVVTIVPSLQRDTSDADLARLDAWIGDER